MTLIICLITVTALVFSVLRTQSSLHEAQKALDALTERVDRLEHIEESVRHLVVQRATSPLRLPPVAS